MNDERPTVAGVVAQLEARKRDAIQTLERLTALRDQVVASTPSLENPRAVLEYLDYFTQAIDEVVQELTQIAAALPDRIDPAYIELLRRIAANCRTEQRRCLVFRDQCINRPLPEESMRPLLNDLSVTTRDQLTAFYDLANAAARLEQIAGSGLRDHGPRRAMDRRDLFTRFFKPLKGRPR